MTTYWGFYNFLIFPAVVIATSKDCTVPKPWLLFTQSTASQQSLPEAQDLPLIKMALRNEAVMKLQINLGRFWNSIFGLFYPPIFAEYQLSVTRWSRAINLTGLSLVCRINIHDVSTFTLCRRDVADGGLVNFPESWGRF